MRRRVIKEGRIYRVQEYKIVWVDSDLPPRDPKAVVKTWVTTPENFSTSKGAIEHCKKLDGKGRDEIIFEIGEDDAR